MKFKLMSVFWHAEFSRFPFVLQHMACPCYPYIHIESTDSVIICIEKTRNKRYKDEKQFMTGLICSYLLIMQYSFNFGHGGLFEQLSLVFVQPSFFQHLLLTTEQGCTLGRVLGLLPSHCQPAAINISEFFIGTNYCYQQSSCALLIHRQEKGL